jgi:hypothetical protein
MESKIIHENHLLEKDTRSVERSWIDDHYMDPEAVLGRIEVGLWAGNLGSREVEHGD